MSQKIHIELYKTRGGGQRPFINLIKKQAIWYWMASLSYLVALKQGFGGVWSRHCWGRSLVVRCKELVHTHGIVGIQVTLRIVDVFIWFSVTFHFIPRVDELKLSPAFLTSPSRSEGWMLVSPP